MTAPRPLPLSDLLQPYRADAISYGAIAVSRLCTDSREVQPGDVFIASGGAAAERDQYVQQAINQGVSAVLVDFEELNTITTAVKTPYSTPIIAIKQLKQQVGAIAARFYGNPCQQLQMIGVTGTNGKTSTSQFIAQALQQTGIRCGIIGTLGSGFPDHIVPGNLTTPGAIALQQTLADLQQQGASHVTMEASSHSLVQHRVADIPFKVAVFTNLTHDHLDYHGTMENYGQAKRLLFLTPTLEHAVINADDAFGRTLLREFAPRLSCYAYSIEGRDVSVPTLHARNIRFHSRGLSATIQSPWGEGELHSQLLGRFNISNVLATFATLLALGLPFAEILQYLSHLQTVPGRMQCLGGGESPLVVVDYAHTPDALEKALTAVREHCGGQLWCIFGCGGNRDSAKRPIMAQAAEALSDHVIVTDDNPRWEDPQQITADIWRGFAKPANVLLEHDRKQAIAMAIKQARAGDVVLIAGKGHEPYQQIGEQKLPFSDAEVAALELHSTK
jgi:UDP-N-acetylmuramoyl-L-alanyl-D-glutamate--2,6-diaminopimelate ligase